MPKMKKIGNKLRPVGRARTDRHTDIHTDRQTRRTRYVKFCFEVTRAYGAEKGQERHRVHLLCKFTTKNRVLPVGLSVCMSRTYRLQFSWVVTLQFSTIVFLNV